MKTVNDLRDHSQEGMTDALDDTKKLGEYITSVANNWSASSKAC